MLRPWTSMPPTQCEANCTAAAVWRRSRRDPVHIRALRGPRWDAGIARDGCVGVLLSAVSRPCGQGITWRRTSTTHKTSTILNAIPLPTQRDQRAVAYVTDTTGANARPARREAWVPQQCGPWALLSLGSMLRSIQFCSAIFLTRTPTWSLENRTSAKLILYLPAQNASTVASNAFNRRFKGGANASRGVAPPVVRVRTRASTHHALLHRVSHASRPPAKSPSPWILALHLSAPRMSDCRVLMICDGHSMPL